MPIHLRLPAALLVAIAAVYVPVAGPVASPVAAERDPGRIDPPADPLPPGAVARLGTTRLRSPHDMDRVAISPDARTLVTIGRGLEVWDGRSGALLRTIPMVQHREAPRYRGEDQLRMKPEQVVAMGFAATTGRFHVLTETGLLRSCNLTDGTWSEPLARATLVQKPDDSPDYGRGFVSRDGTHFAFVTRAKRFESPALRVEVLEVGRSESVCMLDRAALSGWNLHRFSAENKLVGVRVSGATLTVNWDLAAGGSTTILNGPGEGFLEVGIARSPDGTTLAVAFAPGRGDTVNRLGSWWLFVCDAATGRELYRVPEWNGFVAGFTRDGKQLLSVTRGAVVMADPATDRETHRLKGHATDSFSDFALSAGGKYLATVGGRDRSVIIWNLHTGQPALDLDSPRGPVRTIVFSPDGKTVFTSTMEEHTGWLWDAETGKRKQKLIGDANGRPRIATFTPDGRHLVAGYGNDWTGERNGFAARLWRVSDGALVREFGNHAEGVRAVAVSPDGKHLATASGNQNDGLFLWDIDTGELIREARLLPHPQSVLLAFPIGGEPLCLATSDLTRHREAVNPLTGKLLGAWQVPHSADIHALSPDGRLVLTRESWEGVRDVLTVRRAATGAVVCRLPVQNATHLSAVAFSADGKVVAVGERRYNAELSTVYLCDTTTGHALRTITGHTGAITALAFSPDGTRLATGSTDTTVLIWDLTAKP